MLLPDDASCEDLNTHVQTDPSWTPSFPHEVGDLSYWKHARLTVTKFWEATALEVAIPRSDWRPDFREVYRREAIAVLNRAAEEG